MTLQGKDRYIELDVWISYTGSLLKDYYVTDALEKGYSILSVTLVKEHTVTVYNYEDSWEETEYLFKVILEAK